MKGKSITIVDSGLGNLYSVKRAFEICGIGKVIITVDPKIIALSERLVIPGVGAFSDGMTGLRRYGLDHAICEFARTGRPLLGICLGMQLFASIGQEFGSHQGLGLIDGKVLAIPNLSISGERMKVPFIGWSNLQMGAEAIDVKGILMPDCLKRSVYLVHSYQFIPENKANILASYKYGGNNITAAIIKDNILGLQFHPEKSGSLGIKILTRFINNF